MDAPEVTDAGESWIGNFELEILDPATPAHDPVRVLRWD
jgi:hypothetical protein